MSYELLFFMGAVETFDESEVALINSLESMNNEDAQIAWFILAEKENIDNIISTIKYVESEYDGRKGSKLLFNRDYTALPLNFINIIHLGLLSGWEVDFLERIVSMGNIPLGSHREIILFNSKADITELELSVWMDKREHFNVIVNLYQDREVLLSKKQIQEIIYQNKIGYIAELLQRFEKNAILEHIFFAIEMNAFNAINEIILDTVDILSLKNQEGNFPFDYFYLFMMAVYNNEHGQWNYSDDQTDLLETFRVLCNFFINESKAGNHQWVNDIVSEEEARIFWCSVSINLNDKQRFSPDFLEQGIETVIKIRVCKKLKTERVEKKSSASADVCLGDTTDEDLGRDELNLEELDDIEEAQSEELKRKSSPVRP